MSYEKAIEAAGAKVHCAEYFGSYQGNIWAKVTHEGKTGWVCIGCGSCSGCDSYEAFTSDLGWDVDPTQEQLAEFGRDYLDEILTQEKAEAQCAKDLEWDSDAQKALNYIRENA